MYTHHYPPTRVYMWKPLFVNLVYRCVQVPIVAAGNGKFPNGNPFAMRARELRRACETTPFAHARVSVSLPWEFLLRFPHPLWPVPPLAVGNVPRHRPSRWVREAVGSRECVPARLHRRPGHHEPVHECPPECVHRGVPWCGCGLHDKVGHVHLVR